MSVGIRQDLPLRQMTDAEYRRLLELSQQARGKTKAVAEPDYRGGTNPASPIGAILAVLE